MFPAADMTLTGLVSLLVGCFDGAGPRCGKLLSLTHSSQPKTVEVGKVVTGASCTLALYEGVSPEILKAATRRRQRLATAFITCPCVLHTGTKSGFLIAFFFYTHNKTFYYTH